MFILCVSRCGVTLVFVQQPSFVRLCRAEIPQLSTRNSRGLKSQIFLKYKLFLIKVFSDETLLRAAH